jgi:predicted RNase H-like HicB family nuclease
MWGSGIETEREDDGRWIADVIDLPGVMAYGSTKAEAVAKAKALAREVVDAESGSVSLRR